MRIQRTSQIITVAIIALSLLAIVCAAVSGYYRYAESQAYESRRTTSHFTDQLAKASNRLTDAVRAYAATGDRHFYETFQQELNVDHNRETAMEGLQRLGLLPDELK